MSDQKPQRPPFVIEAVTSKEQVEACFDVRVEVFVVEQGFPVDTELDEYETISSSLLLSVIQPAPPPESTTSINPTSASSQTSKKPIGTIRFTPSKGKISRLAVLKDYRQYGFGKEMMLAVEQHAREHDVKDLGTVRDKEGGKVVRLQCNSQMQVVSFYERLGFSKEGEEFDEEGAPHQKMIKDVELGIKAIFSEHQVNCLSPGFVDTDMTQRSRDDEKSLKATEDVIIVKRISKPDEQAGT